MGRLITLYVSLLLASFHTLAQPNISLTFDDGFTNDQPGYAFKEWNKMILDHLDNAQVTTILFSTGLNKTDEKGQYLLKSWDDRGHMIGNHTYTHPNYNSEHVTFEKFSREILTTDTIINKFDNYRRLFRFPYLKGGNTPDKIERLRTFFKENNYERGYVTIDASDWYVNSRLVQRLKDDPEADITGFRDFYLDHLFQRAMFYEKLSFELTGRHIKHTLLLHHNLAAALFLGDLIEKFKSEGWQLVSAEEAYEDPVFQEQPDHPGESLIWALAKDSGLYEELLRYPAEDSRYEKDEMDRLGL